jgi:hypothetical protein
MRTARLSKSDLGLMEDAKAAPSIDCYFECGWEGALHHRPMWNLSHN